MTSTIDLTQLWRLRRYRRGAARVLQGVAIAVITIMPLAIFGNIIVDILVVLFGSGVKDVSFVKALPSAIFKVLLITAVPGLALWYTAARAARGNSIAYGIIVAVGIPTLLWFFVPSGFRTDPGNPSNLGLVLFEGSCCAFGVTVIVAGAVAQWQLTAIARRSKMYAALLASLDATTVPSSVATGARVRAALLFVLAAIAWALAVLQWTLISMLSIVTGGMGELKLSLFLVLTFVGGLAFRYGRRARAIPLEELRKRDERAPVLFLRSFRDDVIRIKRTFNWDNLLAGWFTGLTLESVIAESAWHFGPVVAIGRPGERIARLGAARQYVRDEEWQSVVARFSRESIATVAIAGTTEGIRWEYGHLEREGLIERLVLIMPRAYAPETEARIQLLREALPSRCSNLPPWDAKRLIAFGFAADAAFAIDCAGSDEDAYALGSLMLVSSVTRANTPEDIALLDSTRLRSRIPVFAAACIAALLIIAGTFSIVAVAPNPNDTAACYEPYLDSSMDPTATPVEADDAAASVAHCERRYGIQDLKTLGTVIYGLANAEHKHRLVGEAARADLELDAYRNRVREIAESAHNDQRVRTTAALMLVQPRTGSTPWTSCFSPFEAASGVLKFNGAAEVKYIGWYSTIAMAVDAFRFCTRRNVIPSSGDVAEHFYVGIVAAREAAALGETAEADRDIAALH